MILDLYLFHQLMHHYSILNGYLMIFIPLPSPLPPFIPYSHLYRWIICNHMRSPHWYINYSAPRFQYLHYIPSPFPLSFRWFMWTSDFPCHYLWSQEDVHPAILIGTLIGTLIDIHHNSFCIWSRKIKVTSQVLINRKCLGYFNCFVELPCTQHWWHSVAIVDELIGFTVINCKRIS